MKYEVQHIDEYNYRITDTDNDDRIATCYWKTDADNVCAALNAQHEANKISLNPPVISSVPLIEFIEEIEYMMNLYGKQRYTQAEAQRDKLAEKLDDIMRLGSNDR